MVYEKNSHNINKKTFFWNFNGLRYSWTISPLRDLNMFINGVSSVSNVLRDDSTAMCSSKLSISAHLLS